jgi:archaellum component FlaF (FlaF/FlaG flagellin family)
MHWVHICVTVHIVFNQEGPSGIWRMSLFRVTCVSSVLSVNLIMFCYLYLQLQFQFQFICSSIQSHMQHWTHQLQFTIYILQNTTYNIRTATQYNITNNNTIFKDQLDVWFTRKQAPSEANEFYVMSNVPPVHSKLDSSTKRGQTWYSALNVYSFMNKEGQYSAETLGNYRNSCCKCEGEWKKQLNVQRGQFEQFWNIR